MNIFEMLILNMLLISYPLLIYILYIVANKNISKKEKNNLFDFILLSTTFLAFHYQQTFDKILLTFFLGGIVFLALFKNKRIISLILEAICIAAYIPEYQSVFYFLGFYFIFNLVIIFYQKHPLSKFSFFTIYVTFYSASFFLWTQLFHQCDIYYAVLLIVVFIVLIYLLKLLLVQGEKLMKNHLEFQELQKEQQIRLSLFKITHEIKNPVAVCKAYLDMFDPENQEHARKYIPILKSEIERLLLLLQDFLLVNKANMKYEIMDVNMLLEDVSKKIQPLMDEKHIQFTMDTIDDELFINGDYNRLNQVMINILKNSIEAQAKEIMLKTHLTSRVLEVYVIDNGDGISKEVLKRMTEPFYTTKPTGTGLGVSLSHEIIDAHSGKIEYLSKEGSGTSVKITLPLYVL